MSRVVVITGASAGVGRAAARAFAHEGDSVALLARGEDGLRGARQEVEEAGGKALEVPTDVSDRDQVERAADAVEEQLGPIDVWVNNGMVSVFDDFMNVVPADFERVTDVVYMGYVNGTRSALERMLPRNRGKIVQVGSALAFRGIPLQSAYCGAKHAVKGFTESIRCELIHRRTEVSITEVHMPALNTPQFHWVKTTLDNHPQPVPPIFQPEIAAQAIVWAAEHSRRHVYVGFPTVATVWANKFIPGLLDRYLGRTGVQSQQASWPIEPNRLDNLYEPVPGDHGAHGEFDDRAHGFSPQLWVTTHRGLAAGVVGAVAALLLGSRRS